MVDREVIGHALAEHMRTELVTDATELAHRRGLVTRDAIFHSDRGSQHLSRVPGHAEAAADAGFDGPRGSCYDNAVAESFFASMKAEIGTRVWATRAAARQAAFAYITYYDHNRLHSTLQHRTPHEARACYRQPIALAA